MPPILSRCVAIHLLKLLSIAALLAGALMLADHPVWAQAGKDGAAATDDKGTGDDKADDQKTTPAAEDQPDADQPEEPDAIPVGVAETGNWVKPKVDLAQKSQEPQIRHILQKGAFENDDQAVYDRFFQTYFFPSWADLTLITKVHDQRTKLHTFFNQSRSAQLHDHLLALSMRFLKILAATNFHPAARYNAMLAIGELNDAEASGPNPAVPHAGAVAVLVDSLKKGPSDALRVAALRGLLRHCGLGIANAQVRDSQVIPALLELATSRPPKDRSPEGHAWMRTLAIESLAALRVSGVAGAAAIGPNGVLDALVKIMGDPASPLSVKCAAARALGSISPAPQFSTTPAQMAGLLRQLTADFCEAELDRYKKFPDTSVFRREVRQRLNDVKKALDGYPGLGEAATGLAQEVHSLIAKLDADKDAKDDVKTKDIEESLSRLKSQGPAAPAAATASAPRGDAAVQ